MKLPYLAFLLFPLFVFAKQDIDFNTQIKSLLSNRCIACHGPDEEDRQAGLRLDDAVAAKAELGSGLTAIVPGNAAASELLARITSSDPDVVMPPPEVGKPISPAEAELLARLPFAPRVHSGAAAAPGT